MTTRERFAANLKALRQHTGKTQQQAADDLRVKRSSYSGYENGSTEPNLELLVRIAIHYRISVETLLRREITFMSSLNNIRPDGTRLMVGMQIH